MSTIETTGMKIVTKDGTEVAYSGIEDVTGAIQGTSLFPSGVLEGAVAVLLSIDHMTSVHEIYLEAPMRQSQLETLDQAIELLTEARDALRARRRLQPVPLG